MNLTGAVRDMLLNDPSLGATFDAAVQDTVRQIEAPNPSPTMITSENGTPRPIFANALVEARSWGALARNEFSLGTHALKPTPWGFVGRWNETQDALATEYLQRRRILVSVDITARAVETVADENRFHPVRDYLDGLEWDRVPRLDRWLHVYAGAEDTAYSRAVGSR